MQFWRSLSRAMELAWASDRPEPRDSVKLIHVDDLRGLDRLPRCQEVEAINYGEYWKGRRQWKKTRRRVAGLLAAEERLAALDTGAVVEYRTEWVEAPRSPLRRSVRVPLPEPPLEGTWAEVDGVALREAFVEMPGRWRPRGVSVSYRGPSDMAHRIEIEELRDRLSRMTEAEADTVATVKASRFGHPVLFVSHRGSPSGIPTRPAVNSPS